MPIFTNNGSPLLGEEPPEPKQKEAPGSATTILTARGGGFEIKALAQTPPLSLLGRFRTQRGRGTRKPLEEDGAEGQGVSLFFLVSDVGGW